MPLPASFSVDTASEPASLALAGLIARSGDVQALIEAAHDRLERLAEAGNEGAAARLAMRAKVVQPSRAPSTHALPPPAAPRRSFSHALRTVVSDGAAGGSKRRRRRRAGAGGGAGGGASGSTGGGRGRGRGRGRGVSVGGQCGVGGQRRRQRGGG
jgi:hypothetical protein